MRVLSSGSGDCEGEIWTRAGRRGTASYRAVMKANVSESAYGETLGRDSRMRE